MSRPSASLDGFLVPTHDRDAELILQMSLVHPGAAFATPADHRAISNLEDAGAFIIRTSRSAYGGALPTATECIHNFKAEGRRRPHAETISGAMTDCFFKKKHFRNS